MSEGEEEGATIGGWGGGGGRGRRGAITVQAEPKL